MSPRTEKRVTVASVWLFCLGIATFYVADGVEVVAGIALVLPGLAWMIGVIVRSLLRGNSSD